jgi:squalene-hopene/tetraprenyl-beta-curcumene cyclase
METIQHKIIDTYTTIIKNTQAVSSEELSHWCSTKTFTEHYFYVDLISYFSPLYSSANESELESFSVICLSFLRGLIGFDKLIDNNESAKFKLGLVNYEIAIKLTTDIFPSNHDFWRDFTKIQACFFSAIDTENVLKNQNNFSKNEFELLSQYKSAYVKVAVSLLSHITNDFSYNKKLNNSLMSLHIAMQYIDDIKDFKPDVANNQVTYIYSQTCNFLTDIGIDFTTIKSDKLYKYMLFSGLAIQHCQFAISHLKQALTFVSTLTIPKYVKFLHSELMQTEKMMWMIEDIIDSHKLKSQLFKNELRLNKQSHIDNIYESKERAVSFVLEKTSKNDYWESFLTDNGKGKLWVSSFIACQLLSAEVSSEKFNAVLTSLSTVPPMQFAFNENTVKDGDSSTFFIQLYKLNKQPLSEDMLASWLNFSNDDGSWCTYRKGGVTPMLGKEPLDSQGWNSNHICVASTAAVVLISHFDELLANKTINYLIATQQANGQWPSYWWTSDIYATSFAVQALSLSKRKDASSSIEKACQWLISKQNRLGYWGDAFYTALAINALLSQDKKYLREIEKGIKWLLENQLNDGSWFTENVLRIPQPDVLQPEKIDKWRNSPFGYNTLTYDNQRSFTTSLIINSLFQFIKFKKKNCANSIYLFTQ